MSKVKASVVKSKQVAIFLLFAFWATQMTNAAPERVVSINLCTDQLAMLVAAPEQLISVSYLAADKSASAMFEESHSFIRNRGLAEEIVRLDPDLVLAGSYTTRATVNLLKRLDVKVLEFEPAYNLDDIRNNLARMGEALDRQGKAQQLIDAFDERIEQAFKVSDGKVLVIGSYGANSYTTGQGSLESELVKAAGYIHLGSQLGLQGTSRLPLENLILANPDVVMTWDRWNGEQGRSTEVLHHPALAKWFEKGRRISVDSRYWICGTPFTVMAINELRQSVLERGAGNE